MLTANHFDASGQRTGTVELPDDLFGAAVNRHLLYLSVRRYQDNRRQGNASTQNAADVRGGGKKPFVQKHTGRARQGSLRSSIMVGGYVAHGPHPRDYYWELPRKMKQAALKSAFADCCGEGRLTVVEPPTATGKTRELSGLLAAMELKAKKVLYLDVAPAAELQRAGRNIKTLSIMRVAEVSPYDILHADMVLITTPGLESVKEALSR